LGLLGWVPTTLCGVVVVSVVRVDSRGRLTIPREVRERSGIGPGSRVVVEVRGRGELVVRLVERDPSEELAELLGGFEFRREDRVGAERLLLREVG